jgi:nucleoside-diphosphate-sugar epimerase
MIIGSGLLARAFAPHFHQAQDVTLFASGVSNSSESSPEAFARERALLQAAIAAGPARLVYFGSCNVANPAQLSAYFEHKRAMEHLVMAAPGGLVLRLPQVVGHTPNPHTLTNFLRDRIVAGEPFTIWTRAQRNLIDIDDVVAIGTWLILNAPADERCVSIATPHSRSMPQIVRLFENTLGRKAKVRQEDRGDQMHVDIARASQVAALLGLNMDREDYTASLIEKYYAPTP